MCPARPAPRQPGVVDGETTAAAAAIVPTESLADPGNQPEQQDRACLGVAEDYSSLALGGAEQHETASPSSVMGRQTMGNSLEELWAREVG